MKNNKKGLVFFMANIAVLFIAMTTMSAIARQMSRDEQIALQEYQNAKASLAKIKAECDRAKGLDKVIVCPKVAIQELIFRAKEKAVQMKKLINH